MEKQIVVGASPKTHKYFFEPSFNDMPAAIREELVEMVAEMSEKVNAVITLGFYEDGNIFIEKIDEDVFTDEIGVELEIKRTQKEKAELLKSVKLWYVMYRTEQGKVLKEVVLMKQQGKEDICICEEIEAKYGEAVGAFAKALLEK